MKITVEHYIEYLFPNKKNTLNKNKKITSRQGKITLPKGAAAYRFYDRDVVTAGTQKVYGKPKNTSGWVYFGHRFTDNMVELKSGEIYHLGINDEVIENLD